MPPLIEERTRRVALAEQRLVDGRRIEATAAEDARRAAEAYEVARGTLYEEEARQAAFRTRRMALGANVRVQRLELELREAELDLRAAELGLAEGKTGQSSEGSGTGSP